MCNLYSFAGLLWGLVFYALVLAAITKDEKIAGFCIIALLSAVFLTLFSLYVYSRAEPEPPAPGRNYDTFEPPPAGHYDPVYPYWWEE